MSQTRAAVLLAFLITLAGCASHSSYSYFRIRNGNALAERRGGGPTQVAAYRDGEIVGAAAAESEGLFGAWTPERPFTDHPSIPHWRRQLAELQELARQPGSRAIDLARATRGFPFELAVAEAWSTWVGDRADRAADLLDHCGEVDLGDRFAEKLAANAVDIAPDDGRAAAWLRAMTAADHDEAVVVLVSSPDLGPRTAEAALAGLDDLGTRHRAPVFAAAARRLLADPTMADVIVAAAEQLPNAEEGRLLADLLSGEAPAELARQVLRHLDDRPSSERARLFRLAAERCYRDGRGQFAIAGALDDLPAMQRTQAAQAVTQLSDVPASLVVMLVDATDNLPGSDREEFLLQVLDGPQGGDGEVRSACAEAARHHLSARSRDRVLQRVGR